VFTGIVREKGRVAALDGGASGVRLVVEARTEAAIGDSVAIDGVCLTVVETGGGRLAFDAVPETLARTSLGRLAPGAEVNLEPALKAGDPLGGHIVQGHVDGVGDVRSIAEDGFARRVRIAVPDGLERYLVEHGSVTVAGVSLTVAGLDEDWFEVSLIPETLERTTLGALQERD